MLEGCQASPRIAAESTRPLNARDPRRSFKRFSSITTDILHHLYTTFTTIRRKLNLKKLDRRLVGCRDKILVSALKEACRGPTPDQ